MTARRVVLAAALLAGVAIGARPSRIGPSNEVAKPEPAALELGDRVVVAQVSRSRPTTTTSTSTTTEAPTTSTTTAPARPASPATPATAVAGDEGSAGDDLGAFLVTCYGPPQFPAGQHTATGAPVGPGSLAVDPRVIPLGTELELEGMGAVTATDTGGAVRGHHVDLWLEDCETRGWSNPTLHLFRR